jgi:hypothetical protein
MPPGDAELSLVEPISAAFRSANKSQEKIRDKLNSQIIFVNL